MSQFEEATDHKRSLNRRQFIKLGGASMVALSVGHSAKMGAGPKPSREPNLLVIITDQQHIDTVAAGGCPYLRTPALDTLAQRGVSFRQSFTPNPICSPARSAMMTGRMSSETGVYKNQRPIRSTIPNLGQWFSENSNYETLYAGKWHLPRSYSLTIPGFKVLHTGIGGQGNVCDPAVSMASEAYLRERNRDRPFLMVASFLQPHDICEWLRLNMSVPQQPRYPELGDEVPPLPDNFEFDRNEAHHIQALRQRYEGAKGRWTPEHWRYYRWSYYRHVEQVDGEIGRLLRALKETGQDENSLILLTSDHGEGLAHHQMVRKSSPYDAALKVPLLISLPGQIPPGGVNDRHLVSGLDIVPTLCDFAGIEAPPKMRGYSLKPLLKGKTSQWRDHVVSEVYRDEGRVVRTERYKYITYRDDPIDMLFDTRKDPGETQNLAQDPKYKSVVSEHREILKQWEAQLDVAPDVPSAEVWWREEGV